MMTRSDFIDSMGRPAGDGEGGGVMEQAKGFTDEEFAAVKEQVKGATPGPWFVVRTDDGVFMNAVYVGTTDRGKHHDGECGLVNEDRCGEIIAITLLQYPRFADHDSNAWDENAELIAAAPTLIATLDRVVAERDALREALLSSGNSVVQARRALIDECPMPKIASALSYFDEALETMGDALACSSEPKP